MSQTRISSFIEAIINVAIGFVINFTANMFIFPLFGFHITLGADLLLGLIYTVISVVRSYAVRRWINARLHKLASAVAASIETDRPDESGMAPRANK